MQCPGVTKLIPPPPISGARCCVHCTHWPRGHLSQCYLIFFIETGVSQGKSSAEPTKYNEEAPQRPWALGALKCRGQACTGTAGPRGRSWALRPASSALGLKYYPGVFNYLFLMDLQGLFHQAQGGWVWGCGERAARARAGKMAHISILKPFTIVSSMKDAANKTEPPAPASPSRKF